MNICISFCLLKKKRFNAFLTVLIKGLWKDVIKINKNATSIINYIKKILILITFKPLYSYTIQLNSIDKNIICKLDLKFVESFRFVCFFLVFRELQKIKYGFNDWLTIRRFVCLFWIY